MRRMSLIDLLIAVAVAATLVAAALSGLPRMLDRKSTRLNSSHT